MPFLKESENLWKTKPKDYHNCESPDDKLHFLLRFAALAPSGHNTQPWIFKVGNHKVELYADRTRCLPVADPKDRELMISCGAALGNLEVAMRYFANTGEIKLFPEENEPDHLATISLGGRYERTPNDIALFDAIQERRTNRRPYEDRQLPETLIEECRHVAKENGSEFLVKTKKNAERSEMGALIAEGDRRQFANESFRRELASWVHSLRSHTHDGMAPYSMGLPKLLDPVAPFMAMVIRRFDLGNGRAADDEEIATQSPALALLCTQGDTPWDWVMAGRALAKILLTLTAKGATASYLNQPIEVDDLRSELKEKAGANGYPQLLLRLGYGPKIDPSSRRPLSQVVRFI